MYRWKCGGAFFQPKCMTLNSLRPKGVLKAVSHRCSFLIGMQLYPFLQSHFEYLPAPRAPSMISSILGRIPTSDLTRLSTSLQSTTSRRDPSFFFTKKQGEATLEVEGLMCPFSSISRIQSHRTSFSLSVMGYIFAGGGRATPSSRLIWNSHSEGGIGKSKVFSSLKTVSTNF